MTTGTTAVEEERRRGKESLLPTQTIPVLRIVVLLNFKPGLKVFANTVFGIRPELPMKRPMRIETGIPDIGDAVTGVSTP